MLLYPNCKINIGLRVVRKREDGYHDLETIFYPVYGLHDELEVERVDDFEFIQEGLAVDCPAEDNLIIKCYLRMREKHPQICSIRISFPQTQQRQEQSGSAFTIPRATGWDLSHLETLR
jgi:4-diphosphocytidyl-2C-methyl-D-erythritol kinase